MQKQISYRRSYLLLVLAIALVLATTAGSYLYTKNRYYRKANRQLIIQNDSIISVNIELKSAVNGKTRTAAASSKPIANGQ